MLGGVVYNIIHFVFQCNKLSHSVPFNSVRYNIIVFGLKPINPVSLCIDCPMLYFMFPSNLVPGNTENFSLKKGNYIGQ